MYAFSPIMVEGHHDASVGPFCSWMLAEFTDDKQGKEQLLGVVGGEGLMASAAVAIAAVAEAESEGRLRPTASWLTLLAGTYRWWERLSPSVRLSQRLMDSMATSVRLLADKRSAGALVLPRPSSEAQAVSAARDAYIRACVVANEDPVQLAETLRVHYIDFLAGVGFDVEEIGDELGDDLN